MKNHDGCLWMEIVGDQFLAHSSDVKFLPVLFSLKIEKLGLACFLSQSDFNIKLICNLISLITAQVIKTSLNLVKEPGGFCFFRNSMSARFCSSVFYSGLHYHCVSPYCFILWFHSARIICIGFRYFLILASASSHNKSKLLFKTTLQNRLLRLLPLIWIP